ncbi:MAG: TIGR03084 family protein [Candidatus Rokubacteria bacterium RIFCSPHIGHO2_12_FULL_73_22]|nr:MAG: TIGR03084 family protein [Candidatus Rokubacteria bacterium RIFCSPHIGHO2_12_FULL_73_22]
MSTPLEEIRHDLDAEQQALDALVAALDPAAWATPTPSAGWAVRDQIAHLAHFDAVAAQALTDPEGFARAVAAAVEDFPGYEARYLERGRALAPADLLAWWRAARRRLAAAAATLEPKARVAWYGPPMSAMSFLSARLMETWLHGHDVTDALGLERRETDRVRHILVLGVRTRAFSYALRGLPAPTAPVRVDLILPSGARWEDGEAGAENRIAGPAVDFCRVVTHRRHVDDTALLVEGPAAREWMLVAQAYAGPPAPGRKPGQFPRANPR